VGRASIQKLKLAVLVGVLAVEANEVAGLSRLTRAASDRRQELRIAGTSSRDIPVLCASAMRLLHPDAVEFARVARFCGQALVLLKGVILYKVAAQTVAVLRSGDIGLLPGGGCGDEARHNSKL